ncbi:MAG TPA: glycosyltransferase [Caulobacteraceae bacterium]|jgi:hypothetical protein|nr:glycosyltransferase [Caulobacteraceae bacterium]
MSVCLAQALAQLGVRTTLVTLGGADWLDGVVQAIRDAQIDYVLAFGSFSADLRTPDGRSIYDSLGCGLIGWDVDHPAYQFKRFTTPIRKRVQICASESHFRFAQTMGCRTAEALMVPGVEAVAEDPLPIEDRPILATVAMSWLGEPQVWWNGAKGTPAYSLIEGVVGRLLADREVDMFAAYQATLADTGLEVNFDENVCNLLSNIGLFVRQYDRFLLGKTLAETDLPCVICGTGWRERLGERPHLTYAESLDFADLGELYGRSRIVLNLNAANGASERAVLAMANGAAVVSDYSPLLQSQFGNENAIRFFDRRNPISVAEAVTTLLTSGEAQAVADQGRALVSQAHLWPHKAACLMETLETIGA